MPKRVLVAALLLLATGCVSSDDYTYDRKEIRAQQEASLAGKDNLVLGQTLDEFFGPRTGWILPSDSFLLAPPTVPSDDRLPIDLGGRAAALSGDGYYLTASHVVDFPDVVMVLPGDAELPLSAKAWLGDREVTLSPGRVVKHFHPADLALVKFGHRPRAHFRLTTAVEPGAAVFSAATDGCFIGQERHGNGPFRARGEVLSVETDSDHGDVTRLVTSIAARGGMSGAPVAGRDGQLVGVITTLIGSRFRTRALSSEALLFRPDELHAAIKEDRSSHDPGL